jgi:hypothetical protein
MPWTFHQWRCTYPLILPRCKLPSPGNDCAAHILRLVLETHSDVFLAVQISIGHTVQRDHSTHLRSPLPLTTPPISRRSKSSLLFERKSSPPALLPGEKDLVKCQLENNTILLTYNSKSSFDNRRLRRRVDGAASLPLGGNGFEDTARSSSGDTPLKNAIKSSFDARRFFGAAEGALGRG